MRLLEIWVSTLEQALAVIQELMDEINKLKEENAELKDKIDFLESILK